MKALSFLILLMGGSSSFTQNLNSFDLSGVNDQILPYTSSQEFYFVGETEEGTTTAPFEKYKLSEQEVEDLFYNAYNNFFYRIDRISFKNGFTGLVLYHQTYSTWNGMEIYSYDLFLFDKEGNFLSDLPISFRWDESNPDEDYDKTADLGFAYSKITEDVTIQINVSYISNKTNQEVSTKLYHFDESAGYFVEGK